MPESTVPAQSREDEAIAFFQFGIGAPAAPVPPRERVGAKGHHLALMSGLGLPVPPGFIIETGLCRDFLEARKLPDDLPARLARAIEDLGRRCGKSFGDEDAPLLVSVRSGSVSSMPGMLETILDIGLCDRTVDGLAAESGNPRFAWDSYRRLLASFGSTVKKVPRARFEEAFADEKRKAGAVLDREVDAETHRKVVDRYLEIYEAAVGEPFPQDPQRQLLEAVEAVLLSWTGQRAVEYRQLHHIPDGDGTAVTVQAMVFGNYGYASGTGVAFTRNPSTGDSGLYADFLLNAQGEDIVGGGVDPDRGEELARSLPAVHRQLLEFGRMLENHFADMQDMEFTVQEGRLHLLQTRSGKRTPLAAVRIAVDLAEEGIIDRRKALERIAEVDLSRVRQPRLEIPGDVAPLAKGEVASVGSLSGKVSVSSERARRQKREGDPVILIRSETRTEDLAGIIAADGIITARGGRTSHAAVVARHLGKACLTGCAAVEVDEEKLTVKIGEWTFREGDWISIDDRTSGIYPGRFESRLEAEDPALVKARGWALDLDVMGHPLLAPPPAGGR
jgi:pyruvate,orthophosphate dikinase